MPWCPGRYIPWGRTHRGYIFIINLYYLTNTVATTAKYTGGISLVYGGADEITTLLDIYLNYLEVHIW